MFSIDCFQFESVYSQFEQFEIENLQFHTAIYLLFEHLLTKLRIIIPYQTLCNTNIVIKHLKNINVIKLLLHKKKERLTVHIWLEKSHVL